MERSNKKRLYSEAFPGPVEINLPVKKRKELSIIFKRDNHRGKIIDPKLIEQEIRSFEDRQAKLAGEEELEYLKTLYLSCKN